MPGDVLDEAREMLRTTGPLLTQPIPSSVGPYRRELLETRRVLSDLAAELEAVRAVVEAASNIRYECDSDCQPGIGEHAGRCGALLKAFKAYDAAKAGKAVE